jgi:hypothetical protein
LASGSGLGLTIKNYAMNKKNFYALVANNTGLKLATGAT